MDLSSSQSAFMTHNGLKVRLNHDFCTEYIREENILPWYISIEAFDSLRRILSLLTAIILLIIYNKNLLYSSVIITVSYLVGYFISQSYFEMVLWNFTYGLFYMAYSVIEKFFLPYIAFIVISIIMNNYIIVLSFVIARVLCFILLCVINYIYARYYIRKYRIYIGDVERTAAKLILLYSDKGIEYKQWIEEYARFIHEQ